MMDNHFEQFFVQLREKRGQEPPSVREAFERLRKAVTPESLAYADGVLEACRDLDDANYFVYSNILGKGSDARRPRPR